jgi:spore germination protein GerM
MNRDPFETLRSRNPAPPESLPEAPMTVASRIAAGHPSLRRGLAIAGATAAVVLITGGGWLIWSRAGDRPVVGPATTTTAETTTTVDATIDEVPELVVYFLKDGALIPVARDLRVLNVRPLPQLGPLALDLLLWGPGAWDAGPLPDPVAAAEAQLTTAIPEGTEVLGLTVADGVAAVDFSAEFAAASPGAICQVVYTLTGPYLEAQAVRFLIEGAPQVVGSRTSGLFTPYLEPAGTGTGIESAGREILSCSTPPVMVEHPALGGTLRPGEAVTLLTRGVDATLTLIAADGTLLWNAWAPYGGEPPYLPPEVIEAAGGYGTWATLRVEVEGTGAAAELPVWLEPDVPFTDEPGIPEATTTTFGLGEMRPLLEGTLTGCAAETARDLSSFEAALANGPLSLEDLCALVGVPDGEVGSGLFIPVYDLNDGSRLYLGYTAPWGDDLLYANLVSPDGTVRHLLEP